MSQSQSRSRSRSQGLVLSPAPQGREVAAGRWWGAGDGGAPPELHAGLWGCCQRPRPGLPCPRWSGQLRPGPAVRALEKERRLSPAVGGAVAWSCRALLTSVPFPTEDGRGWGWGWGVQPFAAPLGSAGLSGENRMGQEEGLQPWLLLSILPALAKGSGCTQGRPPQTSSCIWVCSRRTPGSLSTEGPGRDLLGGQALQEFRV